jgi:hypothetical protein
MYDGNVTSTGTYKVRLHYAQANGTPCQVRFEGPGGNPLYVQRTALPVTGSADTFAYWEPDTTFPLTKGPVSMSMFIQTGGCDIDSFDIYPWNCNSTVCCASTCVDSSGNMACGSTGCSGFTGGADRCCTGTIKTNGFSCGGEPINNAPCVLP